MLVSVPATVPPLIVTLLLLVIAPAVVPPVSTRLALLVIGGATLPPPMVNVPALTVRLPVNVLAPERVSVPAPALTSDSAPPPLPSWIAPAYVLLPARLTVRVAGVALAFCTTGVPTVALVSSPPIATLLPLRLNIPVLDAPKAIGFGVLTFRARTLPTWRFPALIVTPPVKSLLPPLSVRVPAPPLTSASVPPPPSMIRPEKLLLLALLIVSVAGVAAPFSTKGALVLLLKPLRVTLLPFSSRMPELIVTVFAFVLSAPALFNCSVPALMVTPPVKLLLPSRIRVPPPDLFSAKAPLPPLDNVPA